jgi:hypothetical protein
MLVLLGEQSGRQLLASALGVGVSWVDVHQGIFVVWCGATGLHLLGRIVPAVRLTVRRGGAQRVPGTLVRTLLLVATVATAVVLAVVLVRGDASWQHASFGPDHQRPTGAAATRG